MAFFKEVWAKDIKGNLFADNTFLTALKDRTSEVMGGKTLNITQASAPPDIETGDSISYPLSVVERQDEILAFPLRAFSSPVIRVTSLTEKQLLPSYRESVLSETRQQMADKVANYAFFKMSVSSSASANIKQDGTAGTGQVAPYTFLTSGATAPSSIHESGQDRKSITFGDFRVAALRMNRQNIPQAGRYAIITADQAYQLFGDDMLKYRDPYNLNYTENTAPKIHGFSVIIRSSVAVCATNGTLKDMSLKTASIAATDDSVAIFFQKDSVYKAIGEINPFFQLQDPLYQSDTFSFNQYIGIGRERKDSKGLILLREAKIA